MTTARTGTPAWVTTIVGKVHKEYRPKAMHGPTVKWLWSRGGETGRPNFYSTGHCGWSALTVTAGTDLTDQKFVLLHELAHWLTPGNGHDDKFWDACLMLTRRFGLTQKEILAHRYWRMAGLKRAAKRARAAAKAVTA